MYVLFVDLSGFTAYTERHGERAAAELAASFCSRAMQVGRRSGLRPVKTVGDAVIFVSPSPTTAATGALALAGEFDGRRRPLTVHIGVAAGEVIEQDDDVFGFPVNLAAHLSSVAKPGQILVDATVAEELPGDRFETVAAGTRRVKGLSKAVRLFDLMKMSVLREAPS
jgi:class 3 adenylate cyclase